MNSSNDNNNEHEQQERDRMEAEIMQRWAKHMNKTPIRLPFPAQVSAVQESQPVRTKEDFVQLRLMENGVLFDDLQNIGEVSESLSSFIADMERTGCYDSVKAFIGRSTPMTPEQDNGTQEKDNQPDGTINGHLEIKLEEKKWYKLYIGGGIKHGNTSMKDGSTMQTFGDGTGGLLPKVQFETTASLINLKGVTDKTVFSYQVDPTTTSCVSLSHEAPLYSLLRENSMLRNYLLLGPTGSQWHAYFKALKDTVDFESSRSYKEFQRSLVLRLASLGNVPRPELAGDEFRAFEYSLVWRDLIPRRFASSPYACDASWDVVSQAGSNLKHSLLYEYRMNRVNCDDPFNPTEGYDCSYDLELAGPPGDVGFFKWQGASSFHLPIGNFAACHFSCQAGLIKPLSFGGMCNPRTYLSDRFYVGGPLQLRGFQPSGIGPRAKTGGALVPGGDALGGELFYATTLALSTPLAITEALRESGVRAICFLNAGTLSGWGVPSYSLIKSSRVAIGAGISYGTAMGKLEMTYTVPIRFGPRDVRKSAQFGFGFAFGG